MSAAAAGWRGAVARIDPKAIGQRTLRLFRYPVSQPTSDAPRHVCAASGRRHYRVCQRGARHIPFSEMRWARPRYDNAVSTLSRSAADVAKPATS